MSLSGKVALVTGSTSGIGLAIARAFAGAGCSVMMNGLGERAALHKLAGELARESGMKVACHPADMARPAEITDLVAATHGLVASTHKAAYVAAKHGLIGLTKVMGIECADTGVTCNAICPGFVSTPL